MVTTYQATTAAKRKAAKVTAASNQYSMVLASRAERSLKVEYWDEIPSFLGDNSDVTGRIFRENQLDSRDNRDF